jgi:hypothetical protein
VGSEEGWRRAGGGLEEGWRGLILIICEIYIIRKHNGGFHNNL